MIGRAQASAPTRFMSVYFRGPGLKLPASVILTAGNALNLFEVAPERESVNDMAANAPIGIAKRLAGFNHAF